MTDNGQAPRQRTFFMGATRRVHADDQPCEHEHPCPEPSWWGTGCSCGWKVRRTSKTKVKQERLDHGRQHNDAGQAAW